MDERFPTPTPTAADHGDLLLASLERVEARYLVPANETLPAEPALRLRRRRGRRRPIRMHLAPWEIAAWPGTGAPTGGRPAGRSL